MEYINKNITYHKRMPVRQKKTPKPTKNKKLHLLAQGCWCLAWTHLLVHMDLMMF